MTITLVRGGHVLTMGPAGDLRDGAVAIEDDTIVAVGPWAEMRAARPDADVVGDEHGLVIPGLVNAHTHLSEALIPGMGETLSLFDWAPAVIVPASLQLDREMARVGALLKGIELLSSGVTCVNDMVGHMNLGSDVSLGSVDGLAQIGLRGVVSFGAADSPTGDVSLEVGQIVDEHRALAEHCASTGRIGFRVGLATMLVATDELLTATVSVAAELGAGVHTHLAEVREEVVDARLRWGVSAVRRAGDIGLLDHDVVAGHVIWVGGDEYDLLADKQVRAIYNPVANMILADGVCPVVEMQRADIIVAIGTDGAASNDSQDMLAALKTGALLLKVSKMDPAWFTARDVVRMGTIDGARSLGLADQIGSLEPGKQADVVHLAGDRPGLANVHDPYAQLVYCAGPTDVADVWVAGQRLLADRVHTTVDVAEVIARSRELATKLAPGLPMSHLLDDAPPA